MAKKRRGSGKPQPRSRREQFKTGMIGFACLVLGLALTISSAAYKWHLWETADRLRAEGVPVPAAVTNYYDGGSGRFGGPDTVVVSYVYDGHAYHAKILCGSWFTGCQGVAPNPETTVWVDPDRPEEFLAANGNTTGSAFFLNSWSLIPGGLMFTAMGVVGLTIERIVSRDRKRRRSRRGGAARN